MKSPSISIPRSAGLTLIEMLFVMATLSLLGGFGLLVGMDFYRSYSFRSERNIFVSILRKARMLSLVNFGQSAHGVHITPTQYTIFEGASFASSTPTQNEVINIQPTITLSSNPSLPQDIIFKQLDGSVVTSADITISDGLRLSIVSINNEGRIDW